MLIKSKLMLLTGILLCMVLSIGGGSLYVSNTNAKLFETTYQDRILPLKQLKHVADYFAVNVVDTTHKVSAGKISPTEGKALIEDAIVSARKEWDAYAATSMSGDEIELSKKAAAQLELAVAAARKSESLMTSGDKAALLSFAQNEMYPAIDPMSDLVTKLVDLQLREADVLFKKVQSMSASVVAIAPIVVIVAMIIGIFMSFKLIRGLNRDVSELNKVCQHIVTTHDLTMTSKNKSTDELGQISQSVNTLISSMRELVQNVKAQSEQMSASAETVDHTTREISSSTHQQSEATSALASVVEEMAVSVNHISDNANHVSQLAVDTHDISIESSKVVNETLSKISEVVSSISNAEDQVKLLVKHSTEISSVLSVIRDVADQTNLLALNAAIEAARAGEAGRGFAVVADEVRKLAEKSAQSTIKIESIVRDISNAANHANTTMLSSVATAKEGNNMTKTVADAFENILSKIDQVAISANEIAGSLSEQRIASNDMAQQVERIARSSESNSINTNSLESTVESLHAQAEQLHDEVKHFNA